MVCHIGEELAVELSAFERRLERFCQTKQYSIALPEINDPRTMTALGHMLDVGAFSQAYLFVSRRAFDDLAVRLQLGISGRDSRLVFLPEAQSDIEKKTVECIRALSEKKQKKISLQDLRSLAKSPLYQAGYLLAAGHCETAVAGAVATTADVIRAGLATVGLASGVKTVSGAFFMVHEAAGQSRWNSASPVAVKNVWAPPGEEIPGRPRGSGDDEAPSIPGRFGGPGDDGASAMVRHEAAAGGPERIFLYADCGVLVDPSSEQLADIATASLASWRGVMGEVSEARVAFLSFSSKGSAKHPLVDKVKEGLALFRERSPSVLADGELQFDAAIDVELGQRKAPGSPVAGRANIFIFPNLDAGNIAYKITQRLGGFAAYGPLLQGLARPWSDLSRGATAKDIVIASYLNGHRVRRRETAH